MTLQREGRPVYAHWPVAGWSSQIVAIATPKVLADQHFRASSNPHDLFCDGSVQGGQVSASTITAVEGNEFSFALTFGNTYGCRCLVSSWLETHACMVTVLAVALCRRLD